MKLAAQSLVGELRRRIDSDLKQQRYAAMRALNDTAFEIRRGEQRAMQAVFDRPRPQTLNSVRVRPATRAKLVAEVYIDDYVFDAEAVLRPHVFGGERAIKRAERRLQRRGLMPVGTYMVPGRGAPLDEYGNVSGPFIRTLLGYFQAFDEAGHENNLSAKSIARLAKRGRTESGFVTINGVEYFISMGKGERESLRYPHGRYQHLPAGIWSRKGVHGSNIERVFKFVRKPLYRKRFKFFEVADNIARREFPERFRRALSDALRTAR